MTESEADPPRSSERARVGSGDETRGGATWTEGRTLSTCSLLNCRVTEPEVDPGRKVVRGWGLGTRL